MFEVLPGSLYDYPRYYDLVYGSDWEAEYGFLHDCFAKHADRVVHQVFEPACGTGRLLVKLAEDGFEVSGLDLNEQQVAFCNERLREAGCSDRVVVGDMSRFELPTEIDAAFNMISSFRHLLEEDQALSHLNCIASALRGGGLYVLGLVLLPSEGPPAADEAWSARQGDVEVTTRLDVIDLDIPNRRERVLMLTDAFGPSKHDRIEEELVFRTYTADEIASLIAAVPDLRIVETYDFTYEIDYPVTIGPKTQDAVFVLQKRE